jgi:hypothetical protein
MPDAQITVVNMGTGAKVTAVSDQNGTYTDLNLFAGNSVRTSLGARSTGPTPTARSTSIRFSSS